MCVIKKYLDYLRQDTQTSRSTMSSATILFNVSKNELFKLADNYKTLHRKLKVNHRVERYVFREAHILGSMLRVLTFPYPPRR